MKPLTEFHRDRGRPDGRHVYCAECQRKKTREWSAANPERKKASTRADYERNKERYAEKSRRWKQENPELARESSRRAHQKWRALNPGKAKARRRLEMKARRMTDPLSVDYAVVLQADPCAYCGGPCENLDHIVPIVAGGENDWTNLTAACRRCNFRKRQMSLLSWLPQR